MSAFGGKADMHGRVAALVSTRPTRSGVSNVWTKPLP